MKKILPLIIAVTNLFSAHGQVVNEQVDFDTYVSPTNNDFANRFTNGLGLTQITTNGITGGCLTVPTTMNWGNDNAVYCSKYIADSTCRTSVSFKYDTTVFNSSGFDRAVSIFLRPNADFNHYVIASVSHSHQIEILTYSWTNNPYPSLNLVHGHWYDLILRVMFNSNYQVAVVVNVNDLGTTGLTPPIPVNASSGSLVDSVLWGDTAVEVSLTATANGGAKYLDNFKFQGIKSADSCISIPTGIPEKQETDFSVFISNDELIIQSAAMNNEQVAEMYSASGQKIYSIPIRYPRESLDISHMPRGIYFVRLKTSESVSVKKISLVR